MNTYRPNAISILSWITLSFFVLLLPAAARADCNGQWDLSGPWDVTQSNGVTVRFTLQQNGDAISGSGSYTTEGDQNPLPVPVGPGSVTRLHSATVEGGITGNSFKFIATWDGGSVGDYTGTVDANGGIAGTTWDQSHTESGAAWQANRQAHCIVAAAHCPSGYVWRDTFDGDSLCVKPDERHRLANGTCSSGYVWRDTFDGDNVCVTPAQRTAAKAQKRRDELGEVTNRPGASAMGVPANPPAAPVPPPAAQMATANDDVDIYTGPGQEPITGMLAAGTKVPVLGHEPGWYKLKLNVPGGSGWVAEDHLTIGN